jgi:hypothetical protein
VTRIALIAVASLTLAACGGAVEPEAPPASITWDAARGLEVTIHETIDAGAELEIGQVIDDPRAVIYDFITINKADFFAATTDGRADGFVVLSLPAPSSLTPGTVLAHKLERLDRTGLVQPSAAWFSVGGTVLSSR